MESKEKEYLPRWLMKRVVLLVQKFGDREFTFNEAQETLKDDSRIVAIVLSRLTNKGWIETNKSKTDGKKAVYRVKDRKTAEALGEIKL